MKRWLLVAAALVLAALAAVVVLRPGDAPPATDDIDDASREALERVIREETGR